jgi:hypothetical protein
LGTLLLSPLSRRAEQFATGLFVSREVPAVSLDAAKQPADSDDRLSLTLGQET